MAILNRQGLKTLIDVIKAKLNTKVDKEDGKGLSANDLTDDLKEKLVGSTVTFLGALPADSVSVPTNPTDPSNPGVEVMSNDVPSTYALVPGTTIGGAIVGGWKLALGVGYYYDVALPSYFASMAGTNYSATVALPHKTDCDVVKLECLSGAIRVYLADKPADPIPAVFTVTYRPEQAGYYAVIANNIYYAATSSVDGLMSAADKRKLDRIAQQATSVSFTPTQPDGVEIGEISVNGVSQTLYAPDPQPAIQFIILEEGE